MLSIYINPAFKMITVGHPVAFAVGILGIRMLTAGSFLEDALHYLIFSQIISTV